jgi:hypothetical protein
VSPQDTGNEEEDPIPRMDSLHRRIAAAHIELIQLIATMDERRSWMDDGARDIAHWLSMRYDISWWKARRWVESSRRLAQLPRIADALASGRLGIDKVVELTRFATPRDERDLIAWARKVNVSAVRERADLACRRQIEETQEAERVRSVRWWFDNDQSHFGLRADLSAADGAVVAKAIDRLAASLAEAPGNGPGANTDSAGSDLDSSSTGEAFHLPDPWEPADAIEARRADAVVGLCSARIAADPDPDRATVVVHASLDSLANLTGGARIEGGAVIHAETARRLMCDARVETVIEDANGLVLGVGRASREPSAWAVRHIRHRDRGCTFPGCGTRAFTNAHHIVWWSKGGSTDLDNLTLVCSFHHKLVHEHRWKIRREPDGALEWLRPDGTRYRAGPAPPVELVG